MFENTDDTHNDVLYYSVNENVIQECQMTNTLHQNAVDASNIITIKHEDGTEVNYLPFHDDGQIIMTPITLVKEQVEFVKETEHLENGITYDISSVIENNSIPAQIRLTDCNQTSETISKLEMLSDELISTNGMTLDSSIRLIEYDGKLLKTVPISDVKPKQSTRVPPNTYKRTLINNCGQNLIRYSRKNVLVDAKTMINAKEFKNQLMNTSDIIKNLEPAPATKQLIRHMIDSYTKLFAYPAHNMSRKVRDLYTRNCTSHVQSNVVDPLEDMKLLPVGYQVDIDRSKVKQIRRRRHPEIDRKQDVQKTTKIDVDNNKIEIILRSDSSDKDCLNLFSSEMANGEDNGTQIVIIQDCSDSSANIENTVYTQKNIEVLLAAAEESRNSNIMLDDEGNFQVLMTSNQNVESNQIIVVENNEQSDQSILSDMTLELN